MGNRLRRRYTAAAMMVGLLGFTGLRSMNVLAFDPPDGCCGVLLSPPSPDCSFDQTPWTPCQTSSGPECKNENFPRCCNTQGWCGD